MSIDIAGTIEKIELENFMCHKHLSFELSSQVNFIVGENGSGKSAILVALAICFGAKAQFTNRGKRASDVIKNGENYCRIIVYLRNRGEGRIDPTKYGQSIIVERRITRDGGNTYKVSAVHSDGKPKLIGKKASDVNEVLDQFNIPIDNPCILLMQDTSKTFLTATRSEDKYKFFLQATQLDSIKENYRVAEEMCKKARQNEENKKIMLPVLANELKALETKLQNAAGIQQLKMRINELKGEKKWILVRDQKEKVEEVERKIEILEQKMLTYNPEEIDRQIELTKIEIEQHQKDIDELQQEMEQIEEKKHEYVDKERNLDKNIKEMQSEIKDSKGRLELLQKRLRLMKESLNEARNHDKENYELMKQQKEEKIRQVEREIEENKREEEDLRSQIQPLEKELEERARHYGSIEEEVKQMNRTLDNLKKDQNQLENEKANMLTKYHPQMPKLLDLISRTQFEHEIYGPIGECVKLKETKWNYATENCIKRNTLASFIVRTERDKYKLMELGRSLKFDVQVYTYSIKYPNKKYQISKQPYVTLESILEIESPIVFNVLVDHVRIDSVGIAKDRYIANKLLEEHQVEYFYLLDGTCIRKAKKTIGTFPYNIPTRSIYGGKNVDDLLEETEILIHQQMVQIKGKMELKVQAQKDKDEINKEIATLKMKIRQIERDRRVLMSKKREAENIEVKEPEDVGELEENIQKIEEQKITFEEDIRERNRKKIETEQLKEANQSERMILEKKYAKKDKEVRQLSRQQRDLNDKILDLQESRKDVEEQKQAIMNQIQKENENLFESKTTLQTLTENAGNFTYVESKRTLEMVKKEKERCKKKQEELNSEKIDYDAVEKEYQNRKDSYKKVENQLAQIHQLCETLMAELERRLNRYHQLLRVTSTKTMDYFQTLIQKKPGCSGRLRLNHQEKKLDVEVAISNENERNVATLSGGERSFSTVCMLLSLWNVVDCPFRAMDEFDVYMDSMARKIAIETLMETTQSLNKRQYIFITPHNLDGVQSSDCVKVFKIKRPERDTQR